MTKNEIIVENAYGTITLTEPDGNVIREKDVESLLTVMESRLDGYCNPKVSVTTYASDDAAIGDAMDLTMLAAMCCWGKSLYCGDSIKITITAEYCPEDK